MQSISKNYCLKGNRLARRQMSDVHNVQINELIVPLICVIRVICFTANAAQLRQIIENSLGFFGGHLKTLRLYTCLFKFKLDHYLINVARVKSTYRV